MGTRVDLLHQEGALGTVAEVELHHVLLLAGDIGRLGRGVHDMIAVAGQLFHGVSARLQAVDGEAASGAGLVGADDRAAGSAGAGHIADLENSALNRLASDAVIFPDHECRERRILEG